jgi:hypothetical protein
LCPSLSRKSWIFSDLNNIRGVRVMSLGAKCGKFR